MLDRYLIKKYILHPVVNSIRIFNNGGSGKGPITIIGNKHASSIVIARFFSKKLITILDEIRQLCPGVCYKPITLCVPTH